MGLATSSDFLRPAERRYVTVAVPQFGEVRIRSISERERAEYERGLYNDKGQLDVKRLGDQKCRLIALCVVDENGYTILSDADAKRLPDTMDAAIADYIFEACKEHVNLEGAPKNSNGSPGMAGGDSPSSSPTNSESLALTPC